MLLSAVLLNMLNMLNVLGTMRGPFFGGGGGKLAISNDFSGISKCPVQKVLLSAVMLNMLNHVESC